MKCPTSDIPILRRRASQGAAIAGHYCGHAELYGKIWRATARRSTPDATCRRDIGACARSIHGQKGRTTLLRGRYLVYQAGRSGGVGTDTPMSAKRAVPGVRAGCPSCARAASDPKSPRLRGNGATALEGSIACGL